MQPQPIPHDQPISVRLTAQQWDHVMRLLHLATGQLMAEIQAQCLASNVRETPTDVG